MEVVRRFIFWLSEFLVISLWTLSTALPGGVFQDVSSSVSVTGIGGDKAAWGDYNNDGRVDLFVNGRVLVNQSSKFSLGPTIGGDAIWGDYNKDGYLDLFRYDSRTLYRNNPSGQFQSVMLPSVPSMVTRGAAWGDWNDDGYLDLYIGGYETWPTDYHPDCILINMKNGTFQRTWTQNNDTVVTPGRPRPARGITTADFDQDGDLDIFVSNYRLEPNALWINNGAGGFSDQGASRGRVAGDPIGSFPHGHTIGSVFGDFDNDSYIDLFVGNFRHNWGDGSQDHASFYRNRGLDHGFTFQLVKELDGADWQESYASPTAGDIDNDGDLDLFFTTVYSGDNPRLYRNDGNFHFLDATTQWGLSGLGATYQAAFADYDDDGYLDLVTAGKLFRNPGGSNHYIKVRLDGAGIFDTTAIGTQARIDLNGKIFTRQVEGAVGEGNQNDPTLHFGLGSHGGPVTVEIIWPDATVQNVTTDVDLTITVRPIAFLRGDSNGDGDVNTADSQHTLNFLFLGGPIPKCLASADTNSDGDVNLPDAQYTLNFLFLGGPDPKPPFPDYGISDKETDLELGCETSQVERGRAP